MSNHPHILVVLKKAILFVMICGILRIGICGVHIRT